MTPRLALPQTHDGRVERTLYYRCRRGEPAALATLAYRLMDRLYTAASFVAPDEASATTVVLLAWDDTLTLLTRHHVGGGVRVKALQRLGRHLLDYGDPATVRRALHNAMHEDEDSLLPLPDETVQPLVELAQRHAPEIAAAYRERQALRRRLLQSVTAAGLVLLLYGGWVYVGPSVTGQELQLTCLQQRIARRELIESLRDFAAALPDPQGADLAQTRTLQQASLALEEIINAPSRSSLRYLNQRLEREDLPAQMAEIATEYGGAPRHELMQTQLVLEEVQGL
ncbi:MAG: hypothetical protein KKI08_03300 [Armatimonadetes bacterium]|nr:hypothetical protein [Armatimonadota bacterium]